MPERRPTRTIPTATTSPTPLPGRMRAAGETEEIDPVFAPAPIFTSNHLGTRSRFSRTSVSPCKVR